MIKLIIINQEGFHPKASDLDKVFISNFDMPPISKFITRFIKYDNLILNFQLLSMITISKRIGELK